MNIIAIDKMDLRILDDLMEVTTDIEMEEKLKSMNDVIKNSTISSATMRNWKKLNTRVDDRLTSRANKRKSKKRILPLEYFCNLDNIDFVQQILDMTDKEEWPIASVVLSLGISKLKCCDILCASHVKSVLLEYSDIQTIDALIDIKLPNDENDIIGLVYQSFLQEGKKNIIGSYYTPKKVVVNMTRSLDFSDEQTLFDPCCGSGAFLLNVNAPNPTQLYGIDNDKIAVMIAQINLLLKYPDKKFVPQIYCMDFLKEDSRFLYDDIFLQKFNYIITNPPWGAMINRCKKMEHITSNETFSLFFVKSFEQLKENGIIRFLFPESILNVKTHRDIRYFMLHNTCINSITNYNGMFSGVATKYVDIECLNMRRKATFTYYDRNNSYCIYISSVFETKNLVFSFMSEADTAIIKKVKSKGIYTLQQSVWALGIVTGDNKNKLSSIQQSGMEKIYTGKEICPYVLKPAKKYILYDRANLQQVAKEKVYRATEKLVYKFISNKLVFAYDDTQSLFLNSANILIPNIPNMTIKTVLAFLNSELFQFLYAKLFGEVKILKGNLIGLPFPDVSKEENFNINSMVDELIKGDGSKHNEIQNSIFAIYDFTPEQISYIRRTIDGKID